MKRIFQATIIIALIISTIRPAAGQLNIIGNVSVASNLTAKTISTMNGGACTLRGELAIHYFTYAGYLSAKMLGCDIGWLQSYADTNGTPARLGLNPYGGQIHIGTFDMIDDDNLRSDGVTVGPNAKFESDVEVDGKLSVCGGMDPPYLLLDSETRTSIANRVAREVPPSKQTGAALFWNNQTKQLEVYIASEGVYYDLAGRLLAAINAPIAANATVTTGYRIDPVTGGVVARQSVHTPRWQVKPGYRFNSLTGVFTKVGGDSNAAPEAVSARTSAVTQTDTDGDATPATVSAQEALELK